MALDLSFSVEERNDNLVLIITDTTGQYADPSNTGGWQEGAAINPDPADIDGVTHTLELSVTITLSDGTSTTYDDIDLYDEFGPFSDLNDLVFELDCSMFSSSGTALGTDEDEFPDGVYEFTYMYDQGLTAEDLETSTALIEGQVRNQVYEDLRAIPNTYDCEDCKTKYILDSILAKAWLDAIYSSAYVAQTEEILSNLSTLETLVTDGSRYTWQ